MRRLGIIGNPLGHSISPALHEAVIRKLGLDLTYEKWELEQASLSRFLQQVRTDGEILGFNVTIPYKKEILQYLDQTDEEAAALEAVNTVVCKNGRLLGYNTDGQGFLESLASHGVKPEGRSILMLGSGGAAFGVSLALARAGAARIDIAVRNMEKGQQLAASVRSQGVHSQCLLFQDISAEALRKYSLLIQGTSLGMKGNPGRPELPYEALTPDHILADIVYNPLDTPFLEAGKNAGATLISGLEMLAYQGARSFRLWTGISGDPLLMMVVGRKLLEGRYE